MLDMIIDQPRVISLCRENDRKAQKCLYLHFFPIMERMVTKYTSDQDQILDILNDGFLRVFKKIDKYEGKGSFEGWVRKIIYHSVSNYFRACKKDMKFLIYEEEFQDEPSVNAKHSLYYQELIDLVNELPEKHMQVFHLFVIQGYDHEEISQQLKINKNTCRWYLAEARKILQKEYSKKFSSNYNEAG